MNMLAYSNTRACTYKRAYAFGQANTQIHIRMRTHKTHVRAHAHVCTHKHNNDTRTHSYTRERVDGFI